MDLFELFWEGNHTCRKWSKCRPTHRNRTCVPIQVNYGIMGGLAASLSVPIGAKQDVKAGSVPINLCCDFMSQLYWHDTKYIPLHEPHQLTSFEWTVYITMEMIIIIITIPGSHCECPHRCGKGVNGTPTVPMTRLAHIQHICSNKVYLSHLYWFMYCNRPAMCLLKSDLDIFGGFCCITFKSCPFSGLEEVA